MNNVLAIDSSTNSLAFCVMNEKGPVKWGEIFYDGKTVYERLLDARLKTESLSSKLDYKMLAIEKTIKVNSVQTAIKMGYFAGVVMSELLKNNARITEVTPLTWQTYIGNKSLTLVEKKALKKDFPGRSAYWYKEKSRQIRKQRTIDWVYSEYGIKLDSDNVADAFGISYYAQKLI